MKSQSIKQGLKVTRPKETKQDGCFSFPLSFLFSSCCPSDFKIRYEIMLSLYTSKLSGVSVAQVTPFR